MNLESSKSIDFYLALLHQRVDILVNNAGINRIAALDAVNDKDVRDTLQINWWRPFN